MKKVLFICVRNSGRSQMAEGFFNHARDSTVKAISAGIDPAESVNPVVIKVMQEAGIDISKNRPKMITAEMLIDADIVITMGCGVNCPCLAQRETIDWGLTDPEGKELPEIRKIRDQIKENVTALINKLINYRQQEVSNG